MMEEVLLEKKFGKPKFFKVPDGYFEKLDACVMDKIPVTEPCKKRTITRFLRPLAYAACVAAAVVSATVYLYSIKNRHGKQMADFASNVDSQSAVGLDFTIDAMSDYAMFDNEDYYSFIADE